MYSPLSKKILFVLYDGVKNSVFASQVVAPVVQKIFQSPHLDVTIMSFEQRPIDNITLQRIFPTHDRLHLIMIPRLRLMGEWTLRFASRFVFRWLRQNACDEVIARGPLAGWVAMHALRRLQQRQLPPLTIQARGLAAEEYRYAHYRQRQFWYWRWFHAWRYATLRGIESTVYSANASAKMPTPMMISAVSSALKEYLIDAFGADPGRIILEAHDLLAVISPEQRRTWRNVMRSKFNIPMESFVYGYSGSAKPWQCMEQTIDYMARLYESDQSLMFVILTTDIELCKKFLDRVLLPSAAYRLRVVPAEDVVPAIAAFDVGIVFREADPVNWVSRPSKVLEYEAAGVPILHNGTIAWLNQKGILVEDFGTPYGLGSKNLVSGCCISKESASTASFVKEESQF